MRNTQAAEKLMRAQLLDFIKGFYEDPKNQQAYEAWKSKEAKNEDHDHH